MRRLARHLFTLCSAASLLQCVAACVLWARASVVRDDVFWSNGATRVLGASILEGRLTLCRVNIRPGYYRGTDRGFYRRHNPKSSYLSYPGNGPFVTDDVELAGFAVKDWSRPFSNVAMRWVIIPMWAVVASTAVPPAVWAWRWRATRSRRRQGLCPDCGYDLRASPERCPECGKSTPTPAV